MKRKDKRSSQKTNKKTSINYKKIGVIILLIATIAMYISSLIFI